MAAFSEPLEAARAIIAAGAAAWRQGFLPGFSGNLSIRLGNGQVLLTCSGTPKGRLTPKDLALLTQTGEIIASGCARPSSESDLHLQIYARFANCLAILHTHPPYLQALALKLDNLERDFLRVDLYEAQIWGEKLVRAAPAPPGSKLVGLNCANCLATAFGDIVPLPSGVWLEKHGLCALGASLSDCLAFTEQLEHIAKVQLLAL